MMNYALTNHWQRYSTSFMVLLATIIFHVFFFERSLGLNLTFFSLLITVFLVQRNSFNTLSGPARMAMVGALVASAMFYVHHSIIAGFAVILALGIFSAVANEARLRSVFFTGVQLFGNYFMLPIAALGKLDDVALSRGASRKGWRWTKLALFPLLIVVIFFHLYRAGNPKFESLTAGFLEAFENVFADLFDHLFTWQTMFFLFGLIVCAGLLLRTVPSLILQWEQQFADVLVRIRIRRPSWAKPLAMDPLERERRMGMILLLAVNALLLVVNIIDISWVWVGFEVPEGFSLKQFVHEGTWMLIVSILLSMMILMYLFRANLNFYSRNVGLKRLAMLWIAQNFILGMSVFLRNYHYISFHGLAYKRIGVIVFLALVLVGLVTLFMKVYSRKSVFYMVRVNGWAAFAVLIGLTTVDWDIFIVRHNLEHPNKGEIDIDNYLSMSDKVLPMLYANVDVVEAQMAQHRTNNVRWVYHLDPNTFKAELDSKRDRCIARIEGLDLLESNLADRRTLKALVELNEAGRP